MLRLSSLFLSFCCLASTAHAAVIFGDSFSDEYCFFDASGDTFPSSPYAEGIFSNGPIWADYAFPSSHQSYACAGATSTRDNMYQWDFTALYNTGLLGQVSTYLNTSPADIAEQAIYINLSLDEVLSLLANESLSFTERDHLFKKMINNIELATDWLQEAGAMDITLINVPDFSLFPYVSSSIPSILVHRYNKLLAKFALENQFDYFDINEKFLYPAVKNPAAFGFSDVETPCYDGWDEWNLCINDDEYLFWDSIHFTSRAHEWIAEAIVNQ